MSEQTENQYDVGVPYHAEVAVRYSVIDGSKMPSWRHDAFMEVTLCAFDFTTDKEAHFDDKCDRMLNP
ncbi:hypothetical protein [Desulfonema ishimotonii]|uniref:hypothetical protein n=1 Tax=Desulfonema ishimotonii TaxID=45657 RepID=UPI000F5612C5|nr:hypothetical protein [Desulfonema ishimotonii]